MGVARSSYGATNSTKWLSDMDKLIQLLGDILSKLRLKVEHDRSITRRVQVVGACIARLSVQFLRLWHSGVGHVSLIKRQRLVQVPKSIRFLPQLWLLSKLIEGLRTVVRATLEAVEDRYYEWD